MHDFAMKYRGGSLNRDRIRILCNALREVAADPSPVAYLELERRIRRALKITGDELLYDLSGALFLLARVGLVESNGFDAVEPSFTFGADTFVQAAPGLAEFIGRTFEEDEEAPE